MIRRPAIPFSAALLAACVLLSAAPRSSPAAEGSPAPAPGALPESITGEVAAPPAAPAPAHEAESPAPKPPAEHEPRLAPHAGPSAPVAEAPSLARQKLNDQFAALLHLAQRAMAKNDFAAAQADFDKALSLPIPASDKRVALRQMAGFYRDRKMLSKAAIVSERTLALFPNDPENPSIYFELGKIYLDSGLFDLAISRFYSVLNSAISHSDAKEGTKLTRNLSLLAQFEIAEASYAKGDFAAAAKFYSRLQLLEMPEADRPTVVFKNAQSLFQLGDYKAAAAALRGFVDAFPSSPFNPEARNLLARSFQKLKRPEDAVETVLVLLRQEKKSGDPANLSRWQRETGRQIAARFYEDGEFRGALTIYQTLATLDPAPEWQWPVVYQIGLCFERLGLPDRARQAYDFLQRPQTGHTDVAEDKLPPALDAIRGMAKWREDHLAWEQGSGTQLQALLGPLRKDAAAPPPAVEPPANPPAAKAPANESSSAPRPLGKP